MSSLLKAGNICHQWLDAMHTPLAILNRIARVIHPDQYDIGGDALQRLQENPGLLRTGVNAPAILKSWVSIYTAIAIVSDRESPVHRDQKSPPAGMDLLSSVGNYSGCTMEWRNMGLRLDYRPGSVVAFSGKQMQHGVSSHIGQRICLAQYMREAVHEYLGLRRCNWQTYGQGVPRTVDEGPEWIIEQRV